MSSDSQPTKKLAGRVEEVSVGPESDVPDNDTKVVDVAGRKYLLARVNGDIRAFSNRCPHQGAPLGAGKVTGAMLPCEPGEFRFDLDGLVLECPWHRWKYSLQTGEALFDTDRRTIPSFPVRVEDGEVFITVRARPTRRTAERGAAS